MEKYGFVKRKVKIDRFVEFLNDQSNLKLELPDYAVEAFICMANELVFLLVSTSAKSKFQFYDTEVHVGKPLEISDIEVTHASLCGSGTVKCFSLIKNAKRPLNQSFFLTATF